MTERYDNVAVVFQVLQLVCDISEPEQRPSSRNRICIAVGLSLCEISSEQHLEYPCERKDLWVWPRVLPKSSSRWSLWILSTWLGLHILFRLLGNDKSLAEIIGENVLSTHHRGIPSWSPMIAVNEGLALLQPRTWQGACLGLVVTFLNYFTTRNSNSGGVSWLRSIINP